MSNPGEAENAVRNLPVEEKEKSFLFLATDLRQKSVSCSFSAEQIQSWIAEDERGMQEFLALAPALRRSVNLFLDTRVLLAACGSPSGPLALFFIFRNRPVGICQGDNANFHHSDSGGVFSFTGKTWGP